MGKLTFEEKADLALSIAIVGAFLALSNSKAIGKIEKAKADIELEAKVNKILDARG